MTPEDLMVNVQLNQAAAMAGLKQLEALMGNVRGMADQMHAANVAGANGFAQAVNGATESLGSLSLRFLLIIESFKFAKGVFKDTFAVALEGSNAMIASLAYLMNNGEMTTKTFTEMGDGIRLMAEQTGKSFGDIAAMAAHIASDAGLRAGIGDIVVASGQMSKAFGVTDDSFAAMAGTAVKLSGGILTGTQLMEQFNGITGLTGKAMEKNLGFLEDMAKEIGKLTGGGAAFAKSFEQFTGFATKASSQMVKLGGDSEFLQNLIKGIGEGNFGEVATQFPMMAGSLVQMQAALKSGDIAGFGQMLQQGAGATYDWAKNMDAIQLSTLHIDLRNIQALSNLDLSKAFDPQAMSVAERSAKTMQSFGVELQRFYNIMADKLMVVLAPLMDIVIGTMTAINNFLTNHSLIASAVLYELFAAAIGSLIFSFMAFSKVAKTIGTGIGEGFEGMAGGVSRGVALLSKNTPGMLAIGASLLMLGGAVLMVATGITMLAQLGWGQLAVGMTAFLGISIVMAVAAIGLTALGVAAELAAPGILVIAGALLALGGTVLMIAEAFSISATAIGVLGDSFLKLGPGLTALAGSNYLQAAFALYALSGAVMAFSAASLLGSVGIPRVVDSLVALSTAATKLGSINGTSLKASLSGIFSAFNGLDVKANVNVNDGFVGSTAALIDTVVKMEKNVTELLTMGGIMRQQGGLLQSLFRDLFGGPDALFIKAITEVDDNLQHWYGNNNISKGISDSFTNVLNVIDMFSKSFDNILVMSLMLQSKLNSGKTVASVLRNAVDMLYGDEGILTKVVNDVSRNFGSINGDAFDNLGKVTATINRDVTIAAKGGATVALQGYDAASRAAHQEKVEVLLTDIRDALRAAPLAISKQENTTPGWDPSSAFSHFGGDW